MEIVQGLQEVMVKLKEKLGLRNRPIRAVFRYHNREVCEHTIHSSSIEQLVSAPNWCWNKAKGEAGQEVAGVIDWCLK
jgi:hypothetical protein